MKSCTNAQIMERTGLCDGIAVYCQGCMEASHRVNLQALQSCRERLEVSLLQYNELIEALRNAWHSTDRPGDAFESGSILKAKVSTILAITEKQVGWCPWCPGCGGLVHPGECGVH
jgi:hypothetical protein